MILEDIYSFARNQAKTINKFYTQTNKQIKQINQIIETYFYYYMNYKQNNWVGLFLLA
jgi:hypothetical protein